MENRTNNHTKERTKERTSERGQRAENLAADFLQREGLRIILRNYRCKGGEIDLICEEGKTLVFVEVRLRRSASFGGALASITTAKQRRIILAAEHYLLQHSRGSRGNRANRSCRFDCILLDEVAEAQLEWMRDAFSAS